MTNLEAALKYLSKKWSVFPINPTDKKPIVDWKQYQDRLPTVEELNEWWTKWPWASIGLVTGRLSGVSVVDIDPRHNGTIDHLDETVKAETGGGGWHYFYKYSPDAHSQNGLKDGIDLKSDGGYVILPPSVHKSGNKYKWITPPFVNEFKQLPQWIIDSQNAKGVSAFDPSLLRGVSEGKRNESAASVIGKILHGLKEEDWQTIGWQTVTGWNLKNNPPLEEEELFSVFRSIANKEKASKDEKDGIETPKIKWPSPIDEAAYYGLAGEFVKLIEPCSEADPIALLINHLTFSGSKVGYRPYFKVGGTRHRLKLNVAQVGDTSKGRKGVSFNEVRSFFEGLDEDGWAKNIVSGLSSGEGLINAVRDPIIKQKDGKEVIVEEGVDDKNILVIEEEFVSPLKLMSREGNILSSVIRAAWDRGDLRTLTKNSPLKATATHISIVGHITRSELIRYLTGTEMSNGFGNRFLWFCSKRSKEIAIPPEIPLFELNKLQAKTLDAINFAKGIDEITFDNQTRGLWIKIYHDLTADILGLVGSMSGRIEPYTLRLSSIYALLDKSDKIKVDHLRAAVAIIDYCVESLEFIFQDSIGDPLGNEILNALSKNPTGMTKTAINDYFGGHKSSVEISNALEGLLKIGRIKVTQENTSGRSRELFQLNPLNQHPNPRIKYLDKLNQYIEQPNISYTNDSTEGRGKGGISGISLEEKIKTPIDQLSPNAQLRISKSIFGVGTKA